MELPFLSTAGQYGQAIHSSDLDMGTLSVLSLLATCAAPFMYAGFRATSGLSCWARLAGTWTPPVAVVGSAIVLLGMTLCKEADTPSTSQEATCNTTSSLAVPVTSAYVALIGLAWLGALLVKGDSAARKAALGTASIVALLPIALALALWAYVQL